MLVNKENVKENTPPQTHKKPACIGICFTNICEHTNKYKYKTPNQSLGLSKHNLYTVRETQDKPE